jgi:hypothetical protein
LFLSLPHFRGFVIFSIIAVRGEGF